MARIGEAVLRPAKAADAPALAVIHLAARRDAMPWLPVLHDAADVRDWMATTVLPNATVWVAEAGGRPAGLMALADALLEQLYIAPGQQGGGLGSLLLRKAKELQPAAFASSSSSATGARGISTRPAASPP